MIILQLIGLVGALIPFAIGMFVLFHIFRNQKKPADTSNRINKIRLLWFALTRENLFVTTFPWLTKDELDIVGKPATKRVWTLDMLHDELRDLLSPLNQAIHPTHPYVLEIEYGKMTDFVVIKKGGRVVYSLSNSRDDVADQLTTFLSGVLHAHNINHLT